VVNLVQNPVMKFYDYYEEKHYFFILTSNTFLWFSQQKEYKFINFSSKNGLSSNSINAIVKDNNGFMWFGTEDGLNKFDGQNFKVYRHKETDSTSIGRGM
jgi:ligand-binding sensor domain-containing protein